MCGMVGFCLRLLFLERLKPSLRFCQSSDNSNKCFANDVVLATNCIYALSRTDAPYKAIVTAPSEKVLFFVCTVRTDTA